MYRVQRIWEAFGGVARYILVGLHLRDAPIVRSDFAALFLVALHLCVAVVGINGFCTMVKQSARDLVDESL